MSRAVLHDTTYDWSRESDADQYSYLWNPILDVLSAEMQDGGEPKLFDLGCGNGLTAQMLVDYGFDVTGVDPSEQGIAAGKQRAPRANLHVGSAYDDLASIYGQFPIVISMEVAEHCYYPRKFAKTFYDLIADGGVGVLTTPYHGYLKNVALALTGKMDAHFTVLWDGGHIKFFSINTLRQLLEEVGFKNISFRRIGRVPWLAKSIMAVVRK